MTKKFSGVETRVTHVDCCRVEWVRNNGKWNIKELPGSDFTLEADIVLLAMGFLHVAYEGLIRKLRLKLDESGNIAVTDCQTSEPAIFAAGDTVSGASLVVRAINSGRKVAAAINNWMRNKTP
jgi:NADPH-dependent glutamate synthase beta subunit-like oxidoreductase